jgi:hypothetical protein
MAEEKLSNLERKKQELEQELERLQTGLDKSIDDVKEGVSSNMDPKNIIRKYPLPVVGAAIVAGFLLGKEKSSTRISEKGSRRDSSPISSEIKRIAAKKGLSLLLDYLEQKITDLKKQKETQSD